MLAQQDLMSQCIAEAWFVVKVEFVILHFLFAKWWVGAEAPV